MPIYRFSFESPLSPKKVEEQLSRQIRRRRGLFDWFSQIINRPQDEEKPWIGDVSTGRFSIYRFIRYRNSFLPQIFGKIHPTPFGSSITILMTLHPVVFVFIAIFLFFTTKGALDFPNDHGAWLMPLFMIALTIGAFIPEAIKAKRILISQLPTRTSN